MIKYIHKLIILSFILFIFSINAFSHNHETTSKPIVFVPNLGQWQEPFKFKGLHNNVDFFVNEDGITFRIGDKRNADKIYEHKISGKDDTLKYHHYNVKWLNANKNPEIIVAERAPFTHNYYLGKDEKNWRSNVALYYTLMYKNIYNAIDLKYYTNQNDLKYDFIVRKGGNPRQIGIVYNGLEQISIKEEQLVLKTSVGNIIELAPYAYQVINGVKTTVACKYILKDNILKYSFPKGYNKNYDLIIDPTMIFSSLSGSTADNWGFTATYDHQGNLYAGGIAFGLGYPTTLGAYQTTFMGGGNPPCDVTISKFNATGNTLIYSTYLGGTGDDMPHSLVVDGSNNLIVAGKTLSLDFPISMGAFQTTHGGGGTDLFITKFNNNGTALLGSTFLGGNGHDGINVSLGYASNQSTLKFNYGDDSRSEVIVDNSNNIYLVASTQSNNFPTSINAVKRNLSGAQDGLFCKMNPTLTTQLYGTLIGGSNSDAAYVIALDKLQQNIYIAGGTQSNDFHHNVNTGSINTTAPGGIADGYIVKFQNSGNYPMLKSTYIGTSAYDQVYGIQVDHSDNVYIMGQTTGAYPVINSTYSNPGSSQFIHKLTNNFNTTLYSTVFGNGNRTSPNLSLVAMLVDTCENVYVSGWGGSITPGSTTNGLPITADALQNTTDGNDFYFFVLAKNAASQLYGSYFGAAGKAEHVDGGTSRFDPTGVIYQSMCASCGGGTAYPSTPGAYSTINGSSNCNIGVVKIAFNMGIVTARATALPSTSGCAPFTVNFNNASINATQYFWTFGSTGGTSAAPNPSYTFNNPGTYSVRLIAHNSSSCTEYDTTYLTIIVRNDTISGDFTFKKLDTCQSFEVSFTNTSTIPSTLNPNLATFLWDFGDGTTFTGRYPPNHIYPNYGTYQVTLSINHPDGCNNPIVVTKNIIFDDYNVSVKIDTPSLVCINQPINLNARFNNAISIFWDFGDGSTSTDANPSHTYTIPGTYTIKVVAINPESCNGADSIIVEISVYDIPSAMFSYTPISPEINKGTQFNNLSEKGNIYNWNFGDGVTSTVKDPYHEYITSGTYRVCLNVKNDAGCEDTHCKNIIAIVQNVAEIPTGFTPNGDGKNDILYVRGYNIETMHLKIFNRFGNLIFESTSQDKGWDGTYNGMLQEMEVYGYTLDVTFKDGKHQFSKGNVTLIQ
jgi:gliding motility-associated-like protein